MKMIAMDDKNNKFYTMDILNNIITSYKHIPYTWNHYFKVIELEKKYIGYIKYPFHDLDKLLMYIFIPFLGTKKISQIHRKYNKHHIEEYKDIDNCNFEEAIIDFESARFTKKDKQLNARETVEYYFNDSKFYDKFIEQLNKFNL